MGSDHLLGRIETIIGQRPDGLEALSGGCVGEVYGVSMPDGHDLVAKVGGSGATDTGLMLERRMLAYLGEHSDVPVPDVLFADNDLLLMERLPSGGGLGGDVQRHAADLIAALHSVTTDQGFGFSFDTVIGGLPQPNAWREHWRDFFAQQRLVYMATEAERVGRLPSDLRARVERFANAIDRWITEPAEPSLIHGDLWGGNVLSKSGRITGLIDPAIYYADPEIELAFSTLFSTFGDAFFSRYQEHCPLQPGFFEERRDIYNLYPLLVHVRLFGGSYVTSVEHTLNRFGF